MKYKSKIFSNSIYLLADYGSVTILSFLFWFILGRLLTPAETGIVFTSWGISSIISGISCFGIGSALSKLISEKRDSAQIKNLIQISFKYIIISNIIVCVGFILLHQYISSIFKFSFTVVLLTAINIFVISVASISGSVVSGLQKMRKIFVTDVCGYLFKLISATLLIFLGLSYSAPLLSLLGAFFLIFLLRVELSWFSFKVDNALREILFKFASPTFISSLASIVFLNIQYIILTIVKNTEATGLFGYALLFTSPLDLIPITFSSALFPIISHLSSGKEKKMQGYLLNLVLRYSLLIVLPVSVFLIFFSRQVLFYLFPKYLSATSLFPLLIPGAIIFGIANIFISVIYAAKKPEVTRNIMIFVVVLLLILSIPMTQMFSSIGLASAYLISNFFMLALSYFYIKKFIKFTINWFSFLKLFISTVFFFGFLIISDFIPTSLLFKILAITIGFISYLLILFFMKFYIKEDFDTIKAMIRRLPIMRKQIFDFVKFLENHL